MEQYLTKTAQETEKVAYNMAPRLKPGDVIAFKGGLGMGKTVFTRGLACGLGLEDDVYSPTFTILNEYTGYPYTLYHFDMYRISGEDDLYSTGYFDYLDGHSIVAIEWSENIVNSLPEDAIIVNIEVLDENTRRITIIGGDRF